MIEQRKVYAYITWGNRLLVFEQPGKPKAGIQVPGGTIEAGESPETAVLREAAEETGLSGLAVAAFLGETRRDMRDYGVEAVHHRYFYHLTLAGNAPERWLHAEHTPSGGGPDGGPGSPIPFLLYWVTMPSAVPPLIAGMGDLLGVLFARISKSTND